MRQTPLKCTVFPLTFRQLATRISELQTEPINKEKERIVQPALIRHQHNQRIRRASHKVGLRPPRHKRHRQADPQRPESRPPEVTLQRHQRNRLQHHRIIRRVMHRGPELRRLHAHNLLRPAWALTAFVATESVQEIRQAEQGLLHEREPAGGDQSRGGEYDADGGR